LLPLLEGGRGDLGLGDLAPQEILTGLIKYGKKFNEG
jgi:hypothetical protein